MAADTSNTSTTVPAVVLTSEALDNATVRSFTLANAAKGAGAASKSDEKALGYLAGVRQAIGTREGEKAVAAAYAIKVGKARGWKQGDVAKEIGVSPSMATLYVRMGLAHEKGVEIGSPTWKALMGKAYANDKDVAAVLTDEGKSADDVVKAVEEKARKVAGSSTDSGSGSGGAGNGTDGGNGGDIDVPRGVKAKIEMIEACLAGLPSDPTEPQFQQIERMVKAVAAYVAPIRKARKAAKAA